MLDKLKPPSGFKRAKGGFTLIELLVTLSVLGVLAAAAMPSYRSFLVNQQLSSASSEFLSSMLQARSESMRLGKNVAVLPVDGASWTSGWYLSVVNSSCTASGNAFGKVEALPSQVTINSTDTNNPFADASPFYAYSPAGFPFRCTGYSGTVMNGTLAFEATETSRKRFVVVSKTGRAKICSSAPNASGDC